jgi:hypothetical protein
VTVAPNSHDPNDPETLSPTSSPDTATVAIPKETIDASTPGPSGALSRARTLSSVAGRKLNSGLRWYMVVWLGVTTRPVGEAAS